MTLRGHVEALEQYIGEGALDFVIAHQAPGGAGGAGSGGAGGEGCYVGELLCACDDDRRAWSVRPTLIEANLVGVVGLEWSKDPMLRHDSRKVANAIKQLIRRVASGDCSRGSYGSSGGSGGKGSGFGGARGGARGDARGGAGESAPTPRGSSRSWHGEEAGWFGSVSPRRGRVALFSLVACSIAAGFAVLGSKFAPRETNPD
jgi:hypothetical protein